MTDFATLFPIKATASAPDLASVASGELVNFAVFSDILAETLETPNLATAAPGAAAAPAVAEQQPASGTLLPEGGDALPVVAPQLAGSPAKGEPAGPTAPTARRGTPRGERAARSEVSAPAQPRLAQVARDSEAKASSAMASSDRGIPTPAGSEAPVDDGGVPLVPLVAGATLAVRPAPLAVLEPLPGPARAPARQPLAFAAAADLPVAREVLEALPPRTTGIRLPGAPALPVPIEVHAAKLAVVAPLTAAPFAPLPPIAPLAALPALTPTQANPEPIPAIPVSGAVTRVAVVGVRSKTLPGVEPAHAAIAQPASVARRGHDESAVVAPLAAPVLGGALSSTGETLNITPATAPVPLATTPVPAAPAASRQDFVALVERLIDSRNAAAPAPLQAALAHAEFGEIALRFTQDERGLNVAMASADPDFAPAVQAALPAERFDRATPEQPRGQPGAGLPQGAAEDRGAHHAAAHSRATPERTAHLAAAPEPGSHDDERPATRTGIFA